MYEQMKNMVVKVETSVNSQQGLIDKVEEVTELKNFLYSLDKRVD